MPFAWRASFRSSLRGLERRLQLVQARSELDDRVLRSRADDAQRIASRLDGVDRLAQQAAIHRDALVRGPEGFPAAVVDRALAFQRHAVLVGGLHAPPAVLDLAVHTALIVL